MGVDVFEVEAVKAMGNSVQYGRPNVPQQTSGGPLAGCVLMSFRSLSLSVIGLLIDKKGASYRTGPLYNGITAAL